MDKNTDQFISLARSYLSIIDNASNLSTYDFLSECLHVLPQIYVLGLKLRDVTPVGTEATKAKISPITSLGSKLGKYDMYRQVSDPIYVDQVLVSLSDDLGKVGIYLLSCDLSEIYQDLKEPLIEYDKGSHIDAIWSWKENIEGHCGIHIVDSLKAIHFLVYDHMGWDYDPSPSGS